MGIAAYNRGTKVVIQEIDSRMPDHNLEVIRRLNKLPRGGAVPFSPTYIRFAHKKSGPWWLMDVPEQGWSSFGYPYKTLAALFLDWSVLVVGCGQDADGFFYRVVPFALEDRKPCKPK